MTELKSNQMQSNLSSVGERHYLIAMITALANRMQAVGDTAFEELTWKQWFALLGVSVFERPPAITQVAELIGTSHQNTKQLMLRLQKAGFVNLSKDPEDQRRTLVHITEREQSFKQKYQKGSEEYIQSIYRGITEEEVQITRSVLARMDRNLQSYANRQKEE
ncbi:MAG: hypothetical protein Q4G61_10680 [Tissierellia bacterium]|nr:hypothetical protein [Tissierellia bacterium]